MIAVVAMVVVFLVVAFVVYPLLTRTGDGHFDLRQTGGELWAREKAVAVLAITEADFDLATGKLSDIDYRILRTDYEDRALQAMDEIEKAVVVAPGAETVRFCAGCGTRFAAPDAFCAGCGRPRDAR